MAYFFEFILFVAKTGTIIVAFIVALLFLASLRNNQQQSGGKIEFKDLGERYQQIKEGFLEFKHSDLDDKDFKAELEREESREKQAEALENASESASEERSETVSETAPENIVKEGKEDKEGDQRDKRDEKSQVAKLLSGSFGSVRKRRASPKRPRLSMYWNLMGIFKLKRCVVYARRSPRYCRLLRKGMKY